MPQETFQGLQKKLTPYNCIKSTSSSLIISKLNFNKNKFKGHYNS